VSINSKKSNFIQKLMHSSLIRVSGTDAQNFLQGQVTCDMREVTAQQSRLGAICNIQGRVIATFRVFFYKEIYYLSLPSTMAAITLQHLKKYAAFSKVKLEEINDTFLHLGMVGSAIATIDKTLVDSAPQQIDAALTTTDCIIIRVAGTEPRWEIFTEKLDSRISGNDNQNAWKLLDLKAGIPTIYPETSGMFTPQMINYPELNGVSFNKGCYLGQEIIARTHYLGKAKRTMHAITLVSQQIPMPSKKVLNEQNEELGIIVDSVSIKNNRYELLIVSHQDNIKDNKLKISL
jgi:folate-binding protein YgfZ